MRGVAKGGAGGVTLRVIAARAASLRRALFRDLSQRPIKAYLAFLHLLRIIQEVSAHGATRDGGNNVGGVFALTVALAEPNLAQERMGLLNGS